MVRKTEKLDTFCKNQTKIPTLGFGKIKGQVTFERWYEQYNESPNILNVHLKTMSDFVFSEVNYPMFFLEMQKEVVNEIEENILHTSTPYQLESYFTLIKKKIENFFIKAEYDLYNWNRVEFDLERYDFKTPISSEKVNKLLFNFCLSKAKDCLTCFMQVQAFIKEQENMYLSKPEIADSVEVADISNKLAHKILLLHELGIIEYLQKEYFHSQQVLRNGTDLANLISKIIGETKSGTVRKDISGIYSKGKDSIMTEKGIRAVKTFLAQLNIPLKRLKDTD
ncbi:hypothetical protein A0256_23785 [Mucilaginibacter sp. PAMC 26640]|nr:hypothetical protein A0256_23785 [Mucilaginibacter sp. PAMC 26640]